VGPAGTDTDALSFDAIELMNGGDLGGYFAVRDDWCSLLDQDINKTGTAVSDSHRAILRALHPLQHQGRLRRGFRPG
jgi:hypothetical protein